MELGGAVPLLAACAVMLELAACGGASPGAGSEPSATAGARTKASGPEASSQEASGQAASGQAESGQAESGQAESGQAGSGQEGSAPAAKANELQLTPQQIQTVGIATAPLRAVEHRQEVAGYGIVLAHETIAQTVAELRTAQAAVRQSRSALERARSLTGTPGAVSADIQEAAAKQAAVDEAALALAERRLSAVIGASPPWSASQRARMLDRLAAGTVKLVRATYPLGELDGQQPTSLRATPLAASEADRGWRLMPVWPAPADASVPGRSVFALLEQPAAAEGERLAVYAPVGAARTGVEVPLSAVVMSEGKYWCYIEHSPGTFVRTEIPVAEPTAAGYFVATALHAGEPVVTAAAAQLLSQESNSGGEPD